LSFADKAKSEVTDFEKNIDELFEKLKITNDMADEVNLTDENSDYMIFSLKSINKMLIMIPKFRGDIISWRIKIDTFIYDLHAFDEKEVKSKSSLFSNENTRVFYISITVLICVFSMVFGYSIGAGARK